MEKLFEFVNEKYRSIEFQDYCEIKPKEEEKEEPLFENYYYIKDTHLIPQWVVVKTDETKECFEKNLLNPIFNVCLHKQIIVIEKNEEKLRIKFYNYYKDRAAGRKFYKVTTSLKYYTYNFKTNAFYEGSMNNFHKKRKFSKMVRRVGPSLNPLNGLKSLISNYISQDTTQLINNSDRINNIFNIFMNAIPGIEKYKDIQPAENRFYKLYLERQGVKLPNNWFNLVFVHPQPKLKDIRKYKLKYIDALMSINKLKGDKLRKILHTVDNFNPHNIFAAYQMFSEGFVLQQSDEFLKKLIESNVYINKLDTTRLTNKERRNAFEIFKLVVYGQLNSMTFDDHLYFYLNVNKFEEVKWKSNTIESFREEHLDWTERHDFYTKGDYKRIYDNEFTNFCKETIFDAQNNEYYPVLLKTSKEYNEESFIQSNCVKSYIQRPGSLIISLRKGDTDSKERATIEFTYLCSKNTDEIILKRVQTLGRFNGKLSEDWDIPVAVLDAKLRMCMNNSNFQLPKIEVKFGHKVIKSNSIFKIPMTKPISPFNRYFIDDDYLRLGWDKSIDINSSNNYDFIPMPLV